jgi:hypothetical protein
MGIKVRAKKTGWFDLKRQREGDVFEIEDKSQLGRWMELVDGLPVSVSVGVDLKKKPPMKAFGE